MFSLQAPGFMPHRSGFSSASMMATRRPYGVWGSFSTTWSSETYPLKQTNKLWRQSLSSGTSLTRESAKVRHDTENHGNFSSGEMMLKDYIFLSTNLSMILFQPVMIWSTSVSNWTPTEGSNWRTSCRIPGWGGILLIRRPQTVPRSLPQPTPVALHAPIQDPSKDTLATKTTWPMAL